MKPLKKPLKETLNKKKKPLKNKPLKKKPLKNEPLKKKQLKKKQLKKLLKKPRKKKQLQKPLKKKALKKKPLKKKPLKKKPTVKASIKSLERRMCDVEERQNVLERDMLWLEGEFGALCGSNSSSDGSGDTFMPPVSAQPRASPEDVD